MYVSYTSINEEIYYKVLSGRVSWQKESSQNLTQTYAKQKQCIRRESSVRIILCGSGLTSTGMNCMYTVGWNARMHTNKWTAFSLLLSLHLF